MKKSSKKELLILVLSLLALATSYRWHQMNKVWDADKILVVRSVVNERQYIMAHLNLIPKPDLLFLGSSRIMLVDHQMFRKDLKVFSSGVSVGIIPDFIAIWQYMKKIKKVPKHVVIYVDPWAFNVNNQQTNWKINSDLYGEFFGNSMETVRQRPMLSLKGEKFVIESELPKDQGGRRFDGSVIYPTDFIRVKTSDEIRQKAQEYQQGCLFCLCDWKFDHKRLEELFALIKDIQKQGSKVMVVLPPYQQQVYDGMMLSPLYSKILGEVVGALDTGDKSDFYFCNAIDPRTSTCAETEFMDGMHYQRTCSEKIVRKCFSHFEPSLLK